LADATLDALADTVRERVPITSVIGETTDLIADEDGSSDLGQTLVTTSPAPARETP
jgi:hypothetical protein